MKSKSSSKFDAPTCPRCESSMTRKAGSIIAARGRVQRHLCQDCGKKFHESLKNLPIVEKEGYFDIETSQAGRGAGNFGIIYSWAILCRKTGKVYGDYMRTRTIAEEKRILRSLVKAMRLFDRLYTWYGTGHDIPVSRSRAEFHRLDYPEYQEVLHSDLYYAWRSRFRLHSNRQDAVAEFLGMKQQKHTLRPEVWVRASFGDKKALKHIFAHNIEDTYQTKYIHERMEKYIQGTRRSA